MAKELVTVKFISRAPGESHSEAHTPLGVYRIDMAQHMAYRLQDNRVRARRPRWYVTNPGEYRSSGDFDSKQDAVDQIRWMVRSAVDSFEAGVYNPLFAVVERGRNFAVQDKLTGDLLPGSFDSRFAAWGKADREWLNRVG